jgi:hypothetical protein
MDFMTIGFILVIAWIALAILVAALCSASSHADAALERAYARRGAL